MKKTITILSALALSAGLSYAGCGKVDTTSGKITSYDAEKKIIVVEAEGGAKTTLTVTPTSKYAGKDGKDVKIEDLQGKTVKVDSEHKKVTSVKEA